MGGRAYGEEEGDVEVGRGEEEWTVGRIRGRRDERGKDMGGRMPGEWSVGRFSGDLLGFLFKI